MTRRQVALLGSALFLTACHPLQDAGQIDQAVTHFHQQLAAGQDDAIYNEVDPAFQKQIDRETNRKFLARVRRKLGVPQVCSRLSYNVRYNPTGALVTTQYNSTFANGAAVEAFTFRLKGGKAVIAGYQINSPLLLTD